MPPVRWRVSPGPVPRAAPGSLCFLVFTRFCSLPLTKSKQAQLCKKRKKKNPKSSVLWGRVLVVNWVHLGPPGNPGHCGPHILLFKRGVEGLAWERRCPLINAFRGSSKGSERTQVGVFTLGSGGSWTQVMGGGVPEWSSWSH